YSPQFAADLEALSLAEEFIEPTMFLPLETAEQVTLKSYLEAFQQRTTLNLEVLDMISGCDAILSAGSPRLAWKADQTGNSLLSNRSKRLSVRLESLAIYNLLGWPAI